MTQQVLKEKLSNITSMKGTLIIVLLSRNVHEEDLYDIYHLLESPLGRCLYIIAKTYNDCKDD